MGNYTIKAKKIIEEYLKENEISKSRFCRLCKISVREFKHLFDYRHSVNNDTFYKIAQTMKLRLNNCLLV